MALISLPANTRVGHPSHFDNITVPYKTEVVVDYAKAAAAKGSALVATDVIQALSVPAGTVVLTAGIQQLVPGNSTTLTLDLGTTADTDAFVAGFNAQSSVAGTYAVKPLAGSEAVVGTTGGTLDITLSALTGTLTTGSVRVFAVLLDVTDRRSPGIVKYTA